MDKRYGFDKDRRGGVMHYAECDYCGREFPVHGSMPHATCCTASCEHYDRADTLADMDDAKAATQTAATD